MKPNEEIIARRVLEAVAEVKDLFRNHAVAMRRHQGVSKTLNGVEVIKYKSGPVLEGYVDAELADGTTFSWLLDVKWPDNSWIIEATTAARSSSGGDQETVEQLPSVTVKNVDEFLQALLEAVRQLLDLRPSSLRGD